MGKNTVSSHQYVRSPVYTLLRSSFPPSMVGALSRCISSSSTVKSFSLKYKHTFFSSLNRTKPFRTTPPMCGSASQVVYSVFITSSLQRVCLCLHPHLPLPLQPFPRGFQNECICLIYSVSVCHLSVWVFLFSRRGNGPCSTTWLA